MSFENEKLSRLLGEVDEDILDEAYHIDSAGKLQELKCEKHGKNIFNIKFPTRFIAAAACLILCAVSILTVLPGFNAGVGHDIPANSSSAAGIEIPSQPGDTTSGHTVIQPDWNDLDYPTITLPNDTLHIEGIDMLNYYSAVRAISEAEDSGVRGLAADSRGRYATLNAAFDGHRGSALFDDGISAPLDDGVSAPIVEPEPTHSDEEPQIYYYEIEPDTLLGFSQLLYFRIEIIDENGFLAQKLGTGVVDVVISREFLWGDDLITFKSGDKYFSCLTNSYHAEYDNSELLWYSLQFSTHKAIDGFYVIKNFEQANYEFNVRIENDQVMSFECADWDKGENPDGVLPVVSKTIVVNECKERFTIAELEDYFNSL